MDFPVSFSIRGSTPSLGINGTSAIVSGNPMRSTTNFVNEVPQA